MPTATQSVRRGAKQSKRGSEIRLASPGLAKTQRDLFAAFASFNTAAESLSGSYRSLQEEVARLRAELDRANEELEQEKIAARRAQALVEMATLLAHEIRNPLASLELFAGLLADASLQNQQARRWADHLQGGMRSLSATVNNVLLLHGNGEPRRVHTNLLRLLSETIEFLEPLARQRGMTIEFVREAGRADIDADPNLLRQAFFNIALNALRAMNPRGRLRVTIGPASSADDSIPVHFQDDGCGIESENLQKIFDTGFTTGGGAGLGLAVTRKILNLHSATMGVKSRIGEGTTFQCVFPLVGVKA